MMAHDTKALDRNYILRTDAARHLYEGPLSDGPGLRYMDVLDAHTHFDGTKRDLPDNAWDLLVGPDHYKKQLMWQAGMRREQIDGQALPAQEKFRRFAAESYRNIGKIGHDGMRLALARHFDWNEPLAPSNADHVWDRVAAYVATRKVTLGSIFDGGPDGKKTGKIKALCTCDNPWLTDGEFELFEQPVDGISWNPIRHGLRVEHIGNPVRFASIGGSNDPMKGLDSVLGREIKSVDDYREAFEMAVRRFADHGNTSFDFSMRGGPYCHLDDIQKVSDKRMNEILDKARRISETRVQEPVLPDDEMHALAYMLPWLTDLAYKAGIPIMYKIGVEREANPYAPEGAHDMVDDRVGLSGILPLLQKYEELSTRDGSNMDWAVLLSSRHPFDYTQMADLASRFRNVYVAGDWWNNDHPDGMRAGLEQRIPWAGFDKTYVFFTDVRSPFDFTRMDIKKRVVANHLGNLVHGRGLTMTEAERVARNAFIDMPKRLFKL